MTRWGAVGGGFALALCSEALVFALTGRVTLVGGVVGSALAGYLVGPEPADGAWHGLLTALSWGIVFIPSLVALAVVGDGSLPFPFEYLVPLFDSSGEATTGMLLAVTLPNVAAGALGSVSRGRDEESAEGWLDADAEETR